MSVCARLGALPEGLPTYVVMAPKSRYSVFTIQASAVSVICSQYCALSLMTRELRVQVTFKMAWFAAVAECAVLIGSDVGATLRCDGLQRLPILFLFSVLQISGDKPIIPHECFILVSILSRGFEDNRAPSAASSVVIMKG